MTGRTKGKPKRATPRDGESADVKAAALAADASKLLAENERLSTELAAAKVRIGELEKQRSDAINRIDWVIDTLQNLVDLRR